MQKSPSAHHCTTLSGCIFANKACIDNWKKIVKQQYVLLVSAQYGELWPTNNWDWFRSLRHPSNFHRFYVLPSLLQRCRSVEANQILHNVWPSPGLVHYIYIFGGSCPLADFCPVQNSLYIRVLCSTILDFRFQRCEDSSFSSFQAVVNAFFNYPHKILIKVKTEKLSNTDSVLGGSGPECGS